MIHQFISKLPRHDALQPFDIGVGEFYHLTGLNVDQVVVVLFRRFLIAGTAVAKEIARQPATIRGLATVIVCARSEPVPFSLHIPRTLQFLAAVRFAKMRSISAQEHVPIFQPECDFGPLRRCKHSLACEGREGGWRISPMPILKSRLLVRTTARLRSLS